ncbi:MAG: carbohydrate ABC transporter permease [Chloroflexi bacterium]|nr:carbohydrate ABC transporter permease [Chloroflexota bacterium]
MVRSKRQKQFDSFIVNALLILVCLVSVFPVAYALSTSFKGETEVITRPPYFFPRTWTIAAYEQIFRSDLVRYHLWNTFVNAFGASILIVVVSVPAAYAFSRYKFRGSNILQLVILALIMIPTLTNLVALYRMASQLDLLNTNLVMIIIYVATGIPFGIWILKASIDAIPTEVEEAALIDGCGPLGVIRNIVIPLALPGLITTFLMEFVFYWNEFLIAVIMLSNNTMKTATVGLLDFQRSYEVAYHVWMAGSIIIIAPVLITFIVLRRQFFRAMLQGAVKG